MTLHKSLYTEHRLLCGIDTSDVTICLEFVNSKLSADNSLYYNNIVQLGSAEWMLVII